MKRFRTGLLATCLLAACLGALPGHAADKPDWAFPVTDKVQPPSSDDGLPKTAPGSDRTYTRAQIDDLMNPPDWYPQDHPAMPNVVAHGGGGLVRACAACHLPTGTGHDESAYIAGLPVNYMMQQMADYKADLRKGSGSMTAIAKGITDDDMRAASAYFAALPTRPWIRVVETATVPKTFVGPGNKRLAHPDGTQEPIGSRIIEIPEDAARVLNRDHRSGFVAYVPVGSIARGEQLAKGNGSTKASCASCHGIDLKGTAEIPGLAGRQATYLVRQLFMIQSGERGGAGAEPMKAIAKDMSLDDMLSLAAYTTSLAP